MAFLSTMNITGSGMTAQQLRLDVIAENITNMSTTQTEGGGTYRRKTVVFQAVDGRNNFRAILAQARGRAAAGGSDGNKGGVIVTEIGEDAAEFKMVYDPTHPDANEEGYVEYPNVDLIKEMTDAMAATQAYSANVTALNVLKSVAAKGLEIGK